MIAFTKMWEDVFKLVKQGKVKDLNIIKSFKSGFIILENENTEFITKQDFLDIWCELLYYNELSKKHIFRDESPKAKYVYKLISKLPYVIDEKEKIKLKE
ncbi:hypothetical protein CPAST_c15410 [Clostridium pasteurianum DSM 525 = ATCC 6013]|uniref:Uncharacterized protein n=1 Tax=Clostridium pasteurianum DSM 525 = ATCC 6013 TaxID=1262449 RepID=A0A0H3J188_CLOPA|nr:hypothetical protein [Clostridium pasteurianum]AJA47616.1 hypothetical protein CPAST_c15410 [Clostridium pasteurianum DSM 525 = ATCC 6013]AJA51604.1 hypothetical protein CLPA_c15410 [Clostridium pasteurianum DSM 525 = ATCC 6013]AOZ74928.1 hypothetical protein AQ983_07450 [Clostridium pasteurianum DSM 525 = ATCC 6013]AOZ78723.1 hypothetical protein AQ984_07440 [Clostridium pasteurianum]ELP58044.1 hypothetical protein F502_16395 [Clostridium pasteurianum DSM 525 = ATCC 6013]